MKEEDKGGQLGFYTRACAKFLFRILRIEIGPSNRAPRAHVSSLPMRTSRHSGASLHVISKSDLNPEEQETVQKSKDPSDIMSANGTAYTTEEATVICV